MNIKPQLVSVDYTFSEFQLLRNTLSDAINHYRTMSVKTPAPFGPSDDPDLERAEPTLEEQTRELAASLMVSRLQGLSRVFGGHGLPHHPAVAVFNLEHDCEPGAHECCVTMDMAPDTDAIFLIMAIGRVAHANDNVAGARLIGRFLRD